MKKKITAGLCALFVLLLAVSPAFACTAVYVGKDASEDGTIMIGRSNDVHPTVAPTMIQVVERVEDTPGRFYKDDWGFSYPLPPTTYKYTCIPISETFESFTIDAAGACNECGVAITATVTAYTNDAVESLDPAEKGICEDSIAGILAACCKTSREAVDLLAFIIDHYGSGEHNIVMIADQNEAWYMEIYCGHQYCAVRMPDDCVAVYGNEYMLTSIDPDDPNTVCSPKLISLPESHGLAKYNADGTFNPFDTYAGEGRLSDYANLRTWTGHSILAPSTAGEYDTFTNYPLFYQPDKKVALQDVFAIFRNRFQGTDYCPDVTGDQGMRVIGTETQAHVHVLQVYPELPADKACVSWVALSQAEFAPFLPVSNAVSRVSEAYSTDPMTRVYDPSYAWYVFKGLNTLCADNRSRVTEVAHYWRSLERALVNAMPEILACDDGTITDLTVYIQDTAMEDAQTLYNDVLTNQMLNTDTLGYSFSYSKLSMSNNVKQETKLDMSLKGSRCEERYGLNNIGQKHELKVYDFPQNADGSGAGSVAVSGSANSEVSGYGNAGTPDASLSSSELVLLIVGFAICFVCVVIGRKRTGK